MKTQTKYDEALKLALEALEKAEESVRMVERLGMRLGLSDADLRMDKETVFKPAITAIKEALSSPNGEAQPAVALEQEPVAWLCKRKDGHFDVLTDQTCTKCFPVYTRLKMEHQHITWNAKIGGIGFKEPMPNTNYKVIATVSPQRKPLTDEQIEKLLDKVIADKKTKDQIGDFARAIEAAHGIKE